jgi:hypothetical protein
VAEVAFLLYLAPGHLPALFALPAGLGDIATGIAALFVAHRLARGTGRRAALWFNAFGMTDLVVALTPGALTGFQLLNVTPSGVPLTELPLALVPTAGVPLLFALHITSVSALARASRTPLPAAGPLTAAPRAAVAPRRHPAVGENTQRRGEDKAARDRCAQGGGPAERVGDRVGDRDVRIWGRSSRQFCRLGLERGQRVGDRPGPIGGCLGIAG